MVDHSAKIAALEEAVGSGELTIKVEGRETVYRSMDELLKALAYLRGQQAAASGPARYATTLATFGECD